MRESCTRVVCMYVHIYIYTLQTVRTMSYLLVILILHSIMERQHKEPLNPRPGALNATLWLWSPYRPFLNPTKTPMEL